MENSDKSAQLNDFWRGIEEPIRDTVKLLRDNGFNTVCSCGHTMTIDITLGNHFDEIERLANLLCENNYSSFKIECTLQVPSDGFWVRRATVYLKDWV